MYVGLKNIEQIFSDYPHLLTSSDMVHCLTGWKKMYNSETHILHLLYVCEYSDDLRNYPFTPDMHLLCIAPASADLQAIADTFPTSVCLLLIGCDHPDKIYYHLQKYFHLQCGVGMYGQTLLEFLALDDGLQAAIEYSFRVFGNPIFVFDTNYNLIAATWEEIERLHLEDSIITNRHFGQEGFQMANRQNHIHEKVRKSEIPIKAYNENLGYEQMYCAIDTKKDLGHIVVSAVRKPFDPIDFEFLLCLKKFISQLLKTDTFTRTTRGFNYEFFLRDLLEEKIAIDPAHLSRMNYINQEFFGNMFCFLVETARSTNTVNAIQIRNMLESRFPNSKTLIYGGQIIAVISVRESQVMPAEYIKAAQKLCKDNGLYAGLSNGFKNILDFREYYKQALRAIELGVSIRNEPSVFQYRDYYLEHICNLFLQKENSATFSHPGMKYLLDYDKAHHSELAYTLYMYLIHERNLAATADAMQMHRTSLVYRFKKINALIDYDFDDPKERMYMILSYEMNKYSRT